jgi:hypothetical protein
MNINQLYELLIDELSENITGFFELHNNTIIWLYTDNDIYESDDLLDYMFDDDESINVNNEENLNDIYYEDKENIEIFLDSINEIDNFSLTDPDINNNSISFKIF